MPAAAFLVFVVVAFPPAPTSHTWRLFLGSESLIAACSALVVAHVVLDPAGRAAILLASRPLAVLGRISYGLYLWHVPVFLVTDYHAPELARRYRIPLELAATLVLAVASYLLVERPALRLKSRLSGARRREDPGGFARETPGLAAVTDT